MAATIPANDATASSTTRELKKKFVGQIYKSLQLPFSDNPSAAEYAYQQANLIKTKGTLFIIPPTTVDLKNAYNTPPRPKTQMSSGAVALCKHFERIPDQPQAKRNQETGEKHPFWQEPKGSKTEKNVVAEAILEEMLSQAVWKNVMVLHRGVVVYEVRNPKGWGMRWTLDVEEDSSVADKSLVNDESADVVVNKQIDDCENELISVNDASESSGLKNGIAGGRDDNTVKSEEKNDIELGSKEQAQSSSPTPVDNDRNWKVKSVTFRGFLEPIEGMNHELEMSE